MGLISVLLSHPEELPALWKMMVGTPPSGVSPSNLVLVDAVSTSGCGVQLTAPILCPLGLPTRVHIACSTAPLLRNATQRHVGRTLDDDSNPERGRELAD